MKYGKIVKFSTNLYNAETVLDKCDKIDYLCGWNC